MTRIAEIKERCEKATPPPWHLGICAKILAQAAMSETDPHRADAAFITFAREDIPWLIGQLQEFMLKYEFMASGAELNAKERDAAEAKLEKAIEVIKFYGSGDRWSYKSTDNEKYLGEKAREFLEQIK